MGQTHLADGGASLLQTASQFSASHASYTALNSQLNGLVEEAQGQWKGAASVAFNQSATHWHEASEKIAQILNDIQENLHSAGGGYDQADDEAASTVTVHF